MGVEIVPVNSQEEAVRDVDIIITSTNARKPFLGPEALAEGVHLSCMQRDEANDEALARLPAAGGSYQPDGKQQHLVATEQDGKAGL